MKKNEKDIPELILKLIKHLENNLQRSIKTPKTENKYEGRLLATTNYGMHPPFEQFVPPSKPNRFGPISKHHTTPSYRIRSPLTPSKDDIALGLYQENNKEYLLIHVPNISNIMETNDFINGWAAKRGQAVELSKSIVPMIPFVLTDYIRMKPNISSKCWTFQIELDKKTRGIKTDPETMEISHFKLYPSKVDNIVMVDSPTDMPPQQLQQIHRILKMRNGSRTQSLFSSPDYRGRYVYNSETDSHEFVASCLASFMVTEATITANHLASVYCLQNKLSIPHIGQPNPNPSQFRIETLGRVYNQKAVLHEYSKLYRPDKITLSNQRHFTYNLSTYTGFASPSSYYLDIFVQKQIAAFQIDPQEMVLSQDHQALESLTLHLDNSMKRIRDYNDKIKYKILTDNLKLSNKPIEGYMLPVDVNNELVQGFFIPSIGLSVNVSLSEPMKPSRRLHKINIDSIIE
ncbi:hypothetical protein DFA_00550 [Cavenderia fasciculata]|uniref:RNB domain-containing protein n=1 Tax=Cavenderia fasciculata TaxID=261658 RepID=F4PSE3_CACFS|nr:uncharacterized protein DFA_00550 [Cavenderia fasciculata]EGG20689.1 hypothetical protein DFA_00550 [Cavenderia fasciculata]|eukprot:XP_004358539.1 hypothetical protein DFA_00550 [Cavenderia fasciculata]